MDEFYLTILAEQLGLDPGLDINKTSLEDYRANLKNLIKVLKGNKAKLIKELEKEMKQLKVVRK